MSEDKLDFNCALNIANYIVYDILLFCSVGLTALLFYVISTKVTIVLNLCCNA